MDRQQVGPSLDQTNLPSVEQNNKDCQLKKGGNIRIFIENRRGEQPRFLAEKTVYSDFSS
jgi:hypothetical protein